MGMVWTRNICKNTDGGDSPTFLSLSESLSEEEWGEGERDLANRGEESISQTAF